MMRGGIGRMAKLGIKLEVLQLTFAVGAIAGMLVEAAMMIAVMSGHTLWIGAGHAR